MLTTFKQCNFSVEFPEILSQNPICYHWLSVSGNSKIMHCGILINVPYQFSTNYKKSFFRLPHFSFSPGYPTSSCCVRASLSSSRRTRKADRSVHPTIAYILSEHWESVWNLDQVGSILPALELLPSACHAASWGGAIQMQAKKI